MAKVGAQRAAELTGRSKSTIQRAMNNGKLSYEVDANERRIIDVSELERVFGLSGNGGAAGGGASQETDVEAEMKRAADMLEAERLKMRVKALEEQLDMVKDQLEDMRAQRDQWQKQAQQVLITSQYSQKQAEELKAELRDREEKARQRRQQVLEERMKGMKGQNENKQDAPTRKMSGKPMQQPGQQQQQQAAAPAAAEAAGTFDFQGLWQKIKGTRAGA